MSDSKGDGKERTFPGILYAEPAALGILANAMSAMVVAVDNMVVGRRDGAAVVTTAVHLIVIGGLLQLFSGLMSFRRNDHFTATAFIFLSTMWTMYGINNIVALSPWVDATALSHATLASLVGYCVGLTILVVCSMTVSYILPPLLLSALLTIVFETVGLFHVWGKRVAAVFEILVMLSAAYASLVIVLKGVSQRYVLPGFGNAPYNVLLIKANGTPSQQKEEKRNTKYAEPYAMSYIANIVFAFVFLLHHCGYFHNFTLALPALLSVALCHVFACYYSYLRHDTFHAVQFFVYLLFWLSRTITEPSVLIRADNFADLFSNTTVVTTSTNATLPDDYALIGPLVTSVILVIASLTKPVMILANNVAFSLLAVFSISAIPQHVLRYTFAVTSAIFFVTSIYTTTASILNTIAEKTIVHVGAVLVSADAMKDFLRKITFWRRRNGYASIKSYDEEATDHNIVEVMCFIGTTISSLAVCGMFVAGDPHTVPHSRTAAVLLVAGTLAELLAMRLSFVTRSLSMCYTHAVMAAIWATWAATIFVGSLKTGTRVTAISLICGHVVVVFLSGSFSRIWIPFTVLVQANTICLLLYCYGVVSTGGIASVMALLSAVSLYGAVATFTNGLLKESVLPVGEPVVKTRSTSEIPTNPPCPLYSSKLTSEVREVARIMSEGGVCGVPTDTVYALSASCKYPDSIVRIFEIKGRSTSKPMCLCLAYLDQLRDVNPDFSPRLWAFMRRCYPGGISCVVPKGPWLDRLGIAHASQHIGNPKSVCIRVPDSAPLAHLITLTGPVVLTSANPSGEVDSTHHDMVIDRLGAQLDGVLCDGYSRELIASTVVNCLNIDAGEISYFREGCYPKEKVDAIFQEVLNSTQA